MLAQGLAEADGLLVWSTVSTEVDPGGGMMGIADAIGQIRVRGCAKKRAPKAGSKKREEEVKR